MPARGFNPVIATIEHWSWRASNKPRTPTRCWLKTIKTSSVVQDFIGCESRFWWIYHFGHLWINRCSSKKLIEKKEWSSLGRFPCTQRPTYFLYLRKNLPWKNATTEPVNPEALLLISVDGGNTPQKTLQNLLKDIAILLVRKQFLNIPNWISFLLQVYKIKKYRRKCTVPTIGWLV